MQPVVGHALLHALLTPYVGLMAHAWLVPAPEDALRDWPRARGFADAYAAVHLATELTHTRALWPLPLLGVPGYADNASAEYYAGLPDYFRRRRVDGVTGHGESGR